MKLDTSLICNCCGESVPGYPGPQLVCPNKHDDNPLECHVLLPSPLSDEALQYLASQATTTTRESTNPFVRYRALLYPYRLAIGLGISDQRYLELVELAASRFERTPLLFWEAPNVVCKDETNNVAHSHKARHLANVLLYFLVLQEKQDASRPRLAVASCGNAGLAAATLAAGVGWDIDVCLPQAIDRLSAEKERLRERFENLGPKVHVIFCPRSFAAVKMPNDNKKTIVPSREDGADPSVAVFKQLVRRGSWPFTVQGTECGLAVEGGQTLAWEILEQTTARVPRQVSKLFVQVGGGALGAGLYQGLKRADQLQQLIPSCAPLAKLPTVITVQAEGAAPLKRAYSKMKNDNISIQDLCVKKQQHEYMFPWENPSSIAYGIIDEVTYDWVELVQAMVETQGDAITVTEDAIAKANELVKSELKVNACLTGSVGLAGLLSTLQDNKDGNNHRMAPPSLCILSGRDRSPSIATRRTCISREDGISFCVLEKSFDFQILFRFNKHHGSSSMNFIPEELVLEHLSKLASGETKVWAAFEGETQLVGFVSAANGSGYWLETASGAAGSTTPFFSHNRANACFVNEFVVRKECRGKRVGKTLAALTVDPDFGIFRLDPTVREMYTTVHADNLASRGAFLRAGYSEVVTYQDDFRNRNTTVLKFVASSQQHARQGNVQRMRVIGVQSGNAVDAIDVGIFDFEPVVRSRDDPRKLAKPVQYTTVANKSFLFTDEERKYILSLRSMRLENGNGYAEGNYKIGEWCADRINQLIRESGIAKSSVALIGSHGQTVSGHPHWELGDLSVIAQKTGIAVAGDFRPADVAAGGNGTPCTCTFDSIMLRPKEGSKWRICINIAGTSSVTFCPPWSASKEQPRGLDPGLGVFFMDLTAQAIDPKLSFDVNGRLARSGTINEALLSSFLSYRYYQQTELPIGVGPDDFPETLWAAWRSRAHSDGVSDLDLMSTFTELTARQIAIACAKFGGEHVRNGKTNDVLLRGGVCNNRYFVERLHWNLEQELQVKIDQIKCLEDLGIDSESWESALYAMMGYLCFNNVYNFVPSCTGASRPVVGGRIAP